MTLAVKSHLAQLFASLAKSKSRRDVKYLLELVSSSDKGEEITQVIFGEAAEILADSGDRDSAIWLAGFALDSLEEAIEESGDSKAKECKPEIETLRSMLKEKSENQKNGTTKAAI